MNPHSSEIDEGTNYIGFREAFDLVCSNARPIGSEVIAIESSSGRICAEDTTASIGYPSVDVSLKDGYAVKSGDVAQASARTPASLTLLGSVFAGGSFSGHMDRGTAVMVCSGAPLPMGADAVVASEFCQEMSGEQVHIRADAEEGRNVLRAGAEIKAGDPVAREGDAFLPGNMGLAAAAGISTVSVYRRPKVAIVAVGDEIVAPGRDLHSGQIYASNLITLKAWLDTFHIECRTSVVRDDANAIELEIRRRLPDADVILTSGGAWGSERDLVVGTLRRLGWCEVFHHVRMGPGKGAALGLLMDKLIFCLPGGPASNEMAFLQLALPGILRMSGDRRHPLPCVPARLAEDVTSRHHAWTEFRDAMLSRDADGSFSVALYRNRSRLQAIAVANGLVCIPEGTGLLSKGQIVPVQFLRTRPDIP